MNEVMSQPMDAENPVRFSVLRVPFFLEPEYNKDECFSETNRVRLERKWGGKTQFAAQKHRHRLKERGQEVGIEKFNLDRVASNTLKSHRLIQWITKNKGCAVAEAVYNDLNHAHFVDGKKLNDLEMLCDAAARAGVAYESTKTFLQSDDGTEEIDDAQDMLREMGIFSIPNFVIGGNAVVSGAVHATELVSIFRKIEATGKGAPGFAFADALKIPPEMRNATLPAPEEMKA
jgi:predicted DsbA family dithiol-disulfide isomerase|tara:strand:+ start:2295 stop:2990 length:696 start_codon:yes stop_codon:yes gene_type:complete